MLNIKKSYKVAMAKAGIDRKELAEMVGISYPTMCSQIRNKPRIDTLERVCNALGIEVSEFLAYGEE